MHLSFHDLNPWLILAIFVSYMIVDGLYARYTMQVVRKQPAQAATTGIIMHLLLSIGVITYVQNYAYILPLIAGSWIGTYYAVTTQRKQ